MEKIRDKTLGIKEVTPALFNCAVGPCPAIFETERKTYILIGAVIDSETAESLFPGRVGEGEMAVEVPRSLLPDVANSL